MSKVQVNGQGIKNRLKNVQPCKAIAEYIWNGFDANAHTIKINYQQTSLGTISSLSIDDDGDGIPHNLLENKFTPVLSSEKYEPEIRQKLTHGKNGLGRLTFHHFAQSATWHTKYKDNDTDNIFEYKITVDESKIDHYDPSNVEESLSNTTGTTVEFNNIFGLSSEDFEYNIKIYLKKEFSWFIELNKNNSFEILINNEPLTFESLISDDDPFPIKIGDISFNIRYIRWKNKLNKHFSRFYCLDSSNNFKYSKPTTLNNKGDSFYHSIFIQSSFFDDFKVTENQAQPDLLDSNSNQSDQFKELIKTINNYLKDKRKPFIVDFAKLLIQEYEENKIFPDFDAKNRWEKMKSDDLKEAVQQLYLVEPKIFTSLNIAQKKTLVGFLALIIDGGDIENLFKVLDGVIELNADEREIFSKQLETTKLTNIIKTIELISDRYKSVADFKKLVFDSKMYAGEVPHLQKMMEKNYWLIGDEYQLLTAAEPDFEEALRRYLYILHGTKEKVSIDHEDKEKEMDLFLIRQDKRNGNIENVVIELKHPTNVRLGKKEIDQVYEYFQVIKSESRFNGENVKWKFFLIGNKFDSTDYIISQRDAFKMHGEMGLVFTGQYKVYAYTWSEIFTEFELRHNYLDQKLKLERSRLTEIHDSADDIVSKIRTSDANPELKIPNGTEIQNITARPDVYKLAQT